MNPRAPSAAALAARDSLMEALRPHAANMDPLEILAVLSYTVGQLVAMQDQRSVTPEIAMRVVSENLAAGNAAMIDGLLSSTGGTA